MKKLAAWAIALLPVISLRAADLPPLKEGYWSIHTVETDQPANKKTEEDRMVCRNHAYDQHTNEMAKAPVACKLFNVTSSGGTITTETDCNLGGTVLHGKATTTVTGDTAVHTETHTTYTPAVKGMSESSMIVDQKYVGACPAGVEPGDIIGADGKKMSSWKH